MQVFPIFLSKTLLPAKNKRYGFNFCIQLGVYVIYIELGVFRVPKIQGYGGIHLCKNQKLRKKKLFEPKSVKISIF